MSSEQYSPLDTTLPFFSNQELLTYQTPQIIPFLLKFKAIARRVKITLYDNAGQYTDVYFDGDQANPTRIASKGNETFNKWIKTIRLVGQGGTGSAAHNALVEYDLVPVEYLPPRTRVG